jgi:hypothetical protein
MPIGALPPHTNTNTGTSTRGFIYGIGSTEENYFNENDIKYSDLMSFRLMARIGA